MSHESGCTQKPTNLINMQGCIRIKGFLFKYRYECGFFVTTERTRFCTRIFSLILYILEQELT